MSLTKRMLEEHEENNREPVLDAKTFEPWDRNRAVNAFPCSHCGANIKPGDVFFRHRYSYELMHDECFELDQGFKRAVGNPHS